AARRQTEAEDLTVWTRLLPATAFRGAFSTAEGRYLFGEREGAFEVLAWGAVEESLPNTEHAGEVVATHLAHLPHPRRVLVLGGGALAVAERFTEVPGVEEVVWLHSDPAYPRALLDVLGPERRARAAGLTVPGVGVREVLDRARAPFDIVVLDLPDVTTLALNRYASREFLTRLRGALAEDGVVSLRVAGGENHLSGEMALLGASAWATLGEVFEHRTLKPGEETWMLASPARELDSPAAELAARYAAIEGADAIYPADAVASLFPADRIAFQVARYEAVAQRDGRALLENTDAEPKALLYTMAGSLHRAGRRDVAEDLVVLLDVGRWILLGGLLILALLHLVHALGPRGGGARTEAAPEDGGLLVLTAGLAVMAVGVVLLFRYQGRFGSLYLEIGLLSAFTMLGLFLGGWGATRLLAARPDEPRAFLPLLVLAFAALLGAIAVGSASVPRAVLAAFFLLVGLVGGAFFPLGARRMEAAGRDAAEAGARLEWVDHLGGAAGALLAGLVLLPLFGATFALVVCALLVATNLVPRLVPASRRRALLPSGAGRAPVPVGGLVLAGVAAWGLLG
ncbi:MAG: spermidine synthase, partial [Planctomycetota bacterium]